MVRRAWSSLGLLDDQNDSDGRTITRARHGHGHSHREMARSERGSHRERETDRLLAARKFRSSRAFVKRAFEILEACIRDSRIDHALARDPFCALTKDHEHSWELRALAEAIVPGDVRS
jgi:hypothetical protein